jgi:hypothetical protein
MLTAAKRKGSPIIKRDEFLQALIEGKRTKLDKLVKELARKNNTTLNSILKVENLFKEHVEFNSRSHLLRELKGSMKASILNTIIARLVCENKLVIHDDHSLTWIDTKENKKLNAQFSKARSI